MGRHQTKTNVPTPPVFEPLESRRLFTTVYVPFDIPSLPDPLEPKTFTSVTVGTPSVNEVHFINQSGYRTDIKVSDGTALITFEGHASVTNDHGIVTVAGGVFIATPDVIWLDEPPPPSTADAAVPDSITVADISPDKKATLFATCENGSEAMIKQIKGGNMAAIDAPGLYLAYGSLTVASAGSLQLGDVALSTISINNKTSVSPVDVSLGRVDRASLTSTVALGTLSVDSWTGINMATDVEPAGTITAPSIEMISSTGDFEATVDAAVHS
jgi:hypothetical protein